MNARHPLGEVTHLWRYPVKSLLRESLRSVRAGRDGFEGDRRSALFVATPGHVREGRPYRGKEHHLLHTVGSVAQAEDLAAERGLALEARDDGPHFDAAPISLVLDTWVAQLAALAGMPLDPQRFRPNLVVRAAPGFAPSEEALVGTTLAGPGIELDVIAAIERCVTITYDVETGASEPSVLRETAQRRNNVMGVYCSVRGDGTIALGDRLTLKNS
jgi:uncharacterized protein YcbX